MPQSIPVRYQVEVICCHRCQSRGFIYTPFMLRQLAVAQFNCTFVQVCLTVVTCAQQAVDLVFRRSSQATKTQESVAEEENASPSSPPSSSSGISDAPMEATTTSPKTSFLPPKPLTHPSAATRLSGQTTLTYHLITPHLALIALLPTDVYEGRRGLVEYNVVFLREGVREIWGVEWERRGA
jgi:hypothetical protein